MSRKSKPNKSNHSKLRQVVGLHACHEALKVRPESVEEVWLRDSWEERSDLQYFANWAKKNSIKLKTRSEQSLAQLSSVHQGVALLLSETPEWTSKDFAGLDSEEKTILMALDEVKDPQNLGAVLRTAWLMGVKALLVPEKRSVHLTPTVMKVASGGAEHVPLWVVNNLSRTLTDLKDKGFWTYGLAAGESSQALWQCRFPEKMVWVLGSEEKGLRETVAKSCDELVKIPQLDAAASYNASVAAAIALSESVRQHQSL